MNRPYAVGPIALLLLLAAGAALAAEKYFAKSGVTLRVVDPSEPGLVFTNRTRSETNTIRYSVALWKMGPDGNPLRLTNEVLARLGPGETSTVVTLFDTTEIRSRLREGNKVVGAIGLDCADCARGYSYRVYISYGEGGWFAEVPNATDGNLVMPPQYFSNGVFYSSDVELSLRFWINEIAASERIPIAPTTK